MIDNDIKRNGSGYYDETPVKSGVFAGPQPGEIWETTMGKEFLIIKNQGGYCNTLALRDSTAHADNIEVVSREARYVNPVMIGYLANREMVQFVKAVPEEKYMEIMEAIGERLGVTIKVGKAEADSLPIQTAQAEEMEAMLAYLEDLKAQRKTLEAERKLWERMYDTLLDRLIARGEVK